MKLTKQTMLLQAICLLPIVSSCDSDNEYYDNPSTIKVLTIEAGANIDLSSRSNWLLYADNLRYQFTVEDGKLLGSPGSPGAAEFTVTAENKTGQMTFILVAENYGKTRQSPAPLLSLRDQQTPDKFMTCDLLYAKYSGVAQENLTGITFYHQNALLDFKTTNLPSGAKVYIMQQYDQKITPLQSANDANAYKAIVYPNNHPSQLLVVVEVNEKTYTQSLESANTRKPMIYETIGISSVVSFTAGIDENDKLVITDFKKTALSNDWPMER